MNDFLKELPALIVTLALLGLAAVLLLSGKMVSSDPLIDTFMTTVVAYWFLHGAYQWQPSSTPSIASSATTPTLVQQTSVKDAVPTPPTHG